MNNTGKPHSSTEAARNPESGTDSLEQILSHAAPRQRPPEDAERAVREAVHAEWLTIRRKSRRRRWLAGAGIAASLALAVLLPILLTTPQPAVVEPVATIARQSGQLYLEPASLTGVSDSGRDSGQLFSGQTVATGPGAQLSLRWTDGSAVRIDANTRIHLRSPTRVELESGRVYIDSGTQRPGADAGRSGAPVLATSAGEIHTLGTQYMVRLAGDVVEVLVREGRIAVGDGRARRLAAAGQQLSIDAAGQSSVQEIPTWGAAWAWAEAGAPPLDLDGLSIHEFLLTVGRETGRRVEFADREAERIARRETLRGSVELPPEEALDVILMATDLTAERINGRIVVRVR